MKIDPNPPENDGNDRLDLRETLQLLDQTTSWFWWNTATTVGLLLVAMTILVAPNRTIVQFLGRQQDQFVVSSGVMALMLIVNGYTLYRRRRLKLFRKHLADQIQFTLKQRRRADKFYGMSITDPLTDLYNRRFGEEKLQTEIERAEQNKRELAVITMDLDYFKEINDHHGHAAGDWVLKEFSRNLRKAIRSCDLPIRLGGDEFLVILPDCSRDNAELILSRLKPFEVVLSRRKITASYSRGMAHYQAGDSPQSIVQRADKSLYAEKATRANPPA
jgi:two-component system cell cycle response regulator